ncbi:hypothetical protein K493DRAFT_304345 [Basidiobolus meristosporus CBS 931.73]|uniref:Uncharacterized protein n=1 Tax=Basidiobolus meristosporus CBS 931.73 TaxID=1314790 RepID=A0A1Y1XZA8_9FUNG|nr:hypothetical protein K493DRAFT_304345 [Basidiobolus meristosporus CBS 931.73]|eukprot:ORX91090.1 hypothetical protein K493DRAFT_304345 [Basidiobolus meristosporus CBS 931.73]
MISQFQSTKDEDTRAILDDIFGQMSGGGLADEQVKTLTLKRPSFGVDMVAMEYRGVDTGDEDVTVVMVPTEAVGDMVAMLAMEATVDATGVANSPHPYLK